MLAGELTDCANNSVVCGELANTCSRTVRELFATVHELIRKQISETQTPAYKCTKKKPIKITPVNIQANTLYTYPFDMQPLVDVQGAALLQVGGLLFCLELEAGTLQNTN